MIAAGRGDEVPATADLRRGWPSCNRRTDGRDVGTQAVGA